MAELRRSGASRRGAAREYYRRLPGLRRAENIRVDAGHRLALIYTLDGVEYRLLLE